MSHSNCCFLACIQISQEAGQVVWYSHLFQNFPQFIVIHQWLRWWRIHLHCRPRFYPYVKKIFWRRNWLLTPRFWPGEFHGQRKLAGYSPWGHRVGRDWANNTSHWIIEKARKLKKKIYFCFIDYTKAFECVGHNKLWTTLKEMEIPNHLICLLRNLYSRQ